LLGVDPVSDSVDEHIAAAFASLDDLTVRELEATAEVLEHRRDGLRAFAGIFRNVAGAREGGWSTDLPRYHLGEAVSRADEDLAGRIAGAEAPFWRHVREAVLAHRRELEEAYR
jgi:hypothetical protein